MKKTLLSALALGIAVSFSSQVAAVDPEQSRMDLIEYFKAKTPDRPIEDYINGIYGYDEDRRMQWEAGEEFPPYLDALDEGKAIYDKDLATYQKCFGEDVTKVRASFPRFNEETKKVEVLEQMINQCRKAAGLKEYRNTGQEMAKMSGYLAYEARGERINVELKSEEAKQAFAAGERFYIEPRGQLGLACASCHVYNASRKARSDILSPVIGHNSHFPAWRLNSSRLVTLQGRYTGCQKNMRAAPSPVFGDDYNNVELFTAYMSNGLEINGPSIRQ
ncbi:MAG: sulfur oxidation c-type cytochrome SoxA [Thiomicrospira sp.]|uniref:sulfur oxidation c-type cytochrome SoxA n=1 Tax=Thiomicrospira sp. TaxID=935 RepID=UPI0019F2827A|nr:sulfur oxidation c-type cytochrome SoxA [Thiomicrospira sp.]MBE0492923.1 sulfur oxidation c-type cytochrome SoxA [Thiomicrospira sp.]